VMGWAAPTDREAAGLVVGAPGAVGEPRVGGVAALNVDREMRATVMALIDGMRTNRVPMIAPMAARGSTPSWSSARASAAAGNVSRGS
jgi:hypothetical protein